VTKTRLLLLIVLVAYLATGVGTVRPDERDVVRRFGRVVARPGPGLWVGLPWGFDRLDRVSVRTARQLTVAGDDGAALSFLTGDQNLVTARLVVEYGVGTTDDDLDRFVAVRDRVDLVLARETEAAVAEWLSARPVDDVLLTGRALLGARLGQSLPARLAPLGLGVIVQRVSVESLGPPDDVREAFEKVNQSQTDVQTKENQARRDADRRLREAEATATRMTAGAEAYRVERVSAATADAETFLARLTQYRAVRAKNPNALSAIWWDETGRILLGMRGRGRIDLLDAHVGKDGLDVSQFLPPKK
jgi:membrane protease subunit HflK